MLFAIPVIFLIVSVYALADAVVLRSTRLHGYKSYAKIVKVERIIPIGLRRFFSKRDGNIRCDYIIQITFPSQDGKTLDVRTTVRAQMKIVDGRRIPFFVVGNQVPIKYHKIFRKVVYFDVDPIKDRQGTLSPIVVWSCCVILLVCIVAYASMSWLHMLGR